MLQGSVSNGNHALIVWAWKNCLLSISNRDSEKYEQDGRKPSCCSLKINENRVYVALKSQCMNPRSIHFGGNIKTPFGRTFSLRDLHCQ
ncbi:hypothetical protein, partial [Xenorhabdus entomophaga]|uniref:hypothetical protein n=1 Tax=Xenorhabdus entomophaga TaxID=3136257 RepID=UPI0030F3DE77